MSGKKHLDEVTGVETTGHVWDGDLRELNKPLPKWWLYVFYACIVWAFGYWIVYPAWPTLDGLYEGLSRLQPAWRGHEGACGREGRPGQISRRPSPRVRLPTSRRTRSFSSSHSQVAPLFSAITAQPATAVARKVASAIPTSTTTIGCGAAILEQIHTTISVGVRSGNPKSHDTAMPRFGLDGVLEPAQISDVANYVRSLSHLDVDTAAAGRGAAIFAEQCSVCHGPDGKGNTELGVPNLTDGIWLYGSSQETVMQSIRTGRGGIMPAWSERLDPVSIKMLALYVHSLGGGKADP